MIKCLLLAIYNIFIIYLCKTFTYFTNFFHNLLIWLALESLEILRLIYNQDEILQDLWTMFEKIFFFIGLWILCFILNLCAVWLFSLVFYIGLRQSVNYLIDVSNSVNFRILLVESSNINYITLFID